MDSIKDRLVGIRLGISYVFLAGLAMIIPGLAIPTISRLFVDRVIVGHSDGLVYPLLFSLIFMALLDTLLYSSSTLG